ncbi:helix-turn-helix transcriptional regulator [Escherichia coli]
MDKKSCHHKNKNLSINNFQPNKNILVFTKNCNIRISTKYGEEMFFPCLSLLFIERNTIFNLYIERLHSGKLYDLYDISEEDVHHIKNIYQCLHCFPVGELTKKRKLNEKVIFLETNHISISIFNELVNVKSKNIKYIHLIYLLSKSNDYNSIVKSFLITAVNTFTDRVKSILAEDISKKWKILDIADIFNISEVAVRKKLEMEYTTFNRILLDVRMNTAFRLISYENINVNKVSTTLGFANTSYFIRMFKEYYGVTPKQLLLCYRESKTRYN